MDFLKILSRSTKQQANKGRTGKDVKAALPSAGLSANPQLYHDVVPESRGKKRKRGGERTVEEKQESEDEDIDFFATPFTASRAKKIAPAPDPTTKAATKEPLPAAEPLDEEECRQILRSHRLKVTLLPCTQVPAKKKKSKKSKPSKPAKGESKQLFPQPLQTFGELRTIYGLSRRMADNLAEQGYKIATEVQMASLPMLLRPDIAFRNSASELRENPNIDLLAVAPTGSGKTLAFLIPIVDQIIQRRRTREDKAAHSLEAIVIAPTKELAHQIVNEAKKLSLGTGVKVAGMKKGMSIVAGKTQEGPDPGKENEDGYSSEDEDQEKTSKKKGVQPVAKADILVATPGLLLSALLTSSPEAHSPLPTVRTLVLDEADVLLDPLFREQTLAIWNSCTSPNLRVRLWSATMGSNIESLAASAIQTRLVSLSPPSTSNLIRLVVGLKDSAIPNIKHDLIYTGDEKGKLLEFRELLRPSSSKSTTLRPPFIVFTQTIPRAIELHHELRYDIPTTAGGSSRIAVLHSDLSDTVRSNIMARFRNGEIWILITTDILSRGVDFKGVNGVVNFDIPQSGASYIHRVGRTGRAGRNGGIAITYYTKEDIPFVKPIGNIIAASEKQAGLKPSEVGMKKWLLDSLPTPSKEEKKKLKMHGVEGRRGGLKKEDGKMIKGKGRISTQSGYERKLENNRKGAIEGSKRRAKVERENPTQDEVAEDSEWGGIDG